MSNEGETNMQSRWTRVLLIALLAATAFGGSFSCESGNNDRDNDDPPTTQSE